MQAIWNTRMIFEDMGGDKALFGTLRENGFEDLKLPTVRAWRARGIIPSQYLPAIISIADVDARDWIDEDLF